MRRRIVPILSSVVLGLATALVPAASAHAVAGPPEPVYAALGDSYASGYGLPSLSGTQSQLCARSAKAYPVRLDKNRADAPTFDFAACSGAITTDIVTPQGLALGMSAPRQDAALSSSTQVVTLTIGGNDVGFGDAAHCLQYPTASGCTDLGNRFIAGLKALAYPSIDSSGISIPDPISRTTVVVTPLATIFADIHAKAPNAQIYVSNYPVLLAECPGGFASMANQANMALNSVIAGAATAAGPMVRMVDVASAFTGHDVCSSEPWISSTTLHPTVAGQEGFANAFKTVIRNTSMS